MTPCMTVTAKEALRQVLAHAKALESESVRLDSKALGRVLSGPLSAPQPSPRWDVSAMDGFAVRSSDFPGAYVGALDILGTAKAGDAPATLSRRGAIRIMTGALVPQGADAVVPKELVRTEGGALFVGSAAEINKGDHIRFAGEELQSGVVVAGAGTRLSSRWIGFLNGLGIASASLHRAPKVSLLVSGNELMNSGAALKPGQIHDSNGPMLEAALSEEGVHTKARRIKDDPKRMEAVLRKALETSDLVMLVGGVSVGDADYSKEAFLRCGVETLFWGVAQKPGKPLFFGKKGKTLVFGLPGNPAAAWVCFHQYVRRALRARQGLPAEPVQRALALKAPRRDESKTLFLKARLSGREVRFLDGQQSHMLRSLAEANALAMVEPEERGSLLEVLPL